MNIRFPSRSRCQAFTLGEILTVMVIFSLLVMAILSSQLFGLRCYNIAETKLAATADGRKALNQVRDSIRGARLLYVGNWTGSAFTPIPDGTPQIGNALRVHPTTNLSVFTCFYLDTPDKTLNSITSAGAHQTIARFITNQLVFQAEDFRGNVLTTDDNNHVVRMRIEFYQWEFPIATIGSGGLYDYYRLQTRITRRRLME